jgi:thioredoxin reductase (NADPH)
VVVASGAQYRRPNVPRLSEFEGHGVWYWASALEAKMCAGSEVILVGGGNSAGQAAVFLAQHAAKVHMLIRGSGLAASMSRYLIDRIEATPNIELLFAFRTHRVSRRSGGRTGAVSWRNNRTGAEGRHPIRNVFLFVGADPETRWLVDCGMKFDDNGFILTGDATIRADGTKPDSLESSIPASSRSATSVPARQARRRCHWRRSHRGRADSSLSCAPVVKRGTPKLAVRDRVV